MKHYETLKTFLVLFFAITLAFVCHFIIVDGIVNGYFNKNHKDAFLIDFYDQSENIGSNPVFFWGSSQIESGINPPLIENILSDFNYSCNVYDLGIEGDTPVRRIPELSHIISDNPKFVIIGLTYYELNTYITPGNEDIRISQLFSSSRVKLTDEEKQFFYADEIKYYNNPLEQYLLKKKYFLMSLDNFILRKDPNAWKNNVKTLFKYTTRDLSPEDKIEEFNRGKGYFDGWRTVGNASNRQKTSLNYTIQKFMQNNITVILINMPLHSLLSNSIPYETRSNYLNFINDTGVIFYDLETAYPDDEFDDMDHLNKFGRTNFSKDIALKIYDIEMGKNNEKEYTWITDANDRNDIIHIDDLNQYYKGHSYDTQEDLTIYKTDSPANQTPLKISLGDGWYSLESDSNSKLRWMGKKSGIGIINIVNIANDRVVNVTLEYGSSIPENPLSVFLDTTEYGKCSGESDCTISNIYLSRGKHTLSLKPKIMINNNGSDPRNLIYLFRNITVYVN